MENLHWYDIIGLIIIMAFVLYIAYKHLSSHPSDKYHNDSWKEVRKRKNKSGRF